MKVLPQILCLLIGLSAGGRGWTDDVPVAPLPLVKNPIWGEVYEVSAKQLKILVSPALGAIVSLQHQALGEWLKAPLRIEASTLPLPNGQQNLTWESRAWRTSEGRQVVMLTRSEGPPLSLRIVHLIEVDPEGMGFQQLTRITATGPGDQELLAPSLKVELTPPDEVQTKQNFPMLIYGDIVSFWHCHWEIESPPQPLHPPLKTEESPEVFILSSRVPGGMDLPPQGWTLLCRLKMNWSTVNTDLPATDLSIK